MPLVRLLFSLAFVDRQRLQFVAIVAPFAIIYCVCVCVSFNQTEHLCDSHLLIKLLDNDTGKKPYDNGFAYGIAVQYSFFDVHTKSNNDNNENRWDCLRN